MVAENNLTRHGMVEYNGALVFSPAGHWPDQQTLIPGWSHQLCVFPIHILLPTLLSTYDTTEIGFLCTYIKSEGSGNWAWTVMYKTRTLFMYFSWHLCYNVCFSDSQDRILWSKIWLVNQLTQTNCRRISNNLYTQLISMVPFPEIYNLCPLIDCYT